MTTTLAKNPIVSLAEGVRTALAGSHFAVAFTPERIYLALDDVQMETISGLRILVSPKGIDFSVASRTDCQDEIQIDVGVLQKLSGEMVVDELVGLVYAIAHFFRRSMLENTPRVAGFRVTSVACPALYSQDHMRTKRLFLAVITMTFLSVEGVRADG